VTIQCLACNQPFETEVPYRRLCPACQEEQTANLRKVLAPQGEPGADPLKKLYGGSPRKKPEAG
jgi:hypothetical protein